MGDRLQRIQCRVQLSRIPANYDAVPGRVNRRHGTDKSLVIFVGQFAFVDSFAITSRRFRLPPSLDRLSPDLTSLAFAAGYSFNFG